MELLKHKAQVAVAQISELVIAEFFHRSVVEPVAATGRTVEAAENIHGRAFAASRAEARSFVADFSGPAVSLVGVCTTQRYK